MAERVAHSEPRRLLSCPIDGQASALTYVKWGKVFFRASRKGIVRYPGEDAPKRNTYIGPLKAAVVARPDMQFVFKDGVVIEAAEDPDHIDYLRLIAQAVQGFVEPTIKTPGVPQEKQVVTA